MTVLDFKREKCPGCGCELVRDKCPECDFNWHEVRDVDGNVVVWPFSR